jgi:hypothetical protein
VGVVGSATAGVDGSEGGARYACGERAVEAVEAARIGVEAGAGGASSVTLATIR